MDKFKKMFVLMVIMGLVYLDLELFMRAIRGDLLQVGFHNVKWVSLAGWTTLWMFFIGGFSGLFIGLLNEGGLKDRRIPIWRQSLYGMIGIFAIEFITGYICNVKLDLNLWTYHGWPLNIMGQITLMYVPLWYLLVPFVIWIDDVIRFYIFSEEKPATIIEYYKMLFKGK